MDYSKAAGIRKQSLLSLIAENKFENGQTVGASIKGAFTDKAKAKWTGYKEKLDPLNWVKGMTGNGVFGKSIRTLAGRAMGKTDEEISYFGGYSRNKKNPHYTTIGAGRIQNLRVGDSIADVLGKMYNFMLKNAEREKLNYEIEKAFREEQTEEDGRRHDALIKSIKDYMKGKATLDKPPPEEEKEKGFWEAIIDGAAAWGAKLLSNLWNAIKFVGNLLAGEWLAGRLIRFFASAAGKAIIAGISGAVGAVKSLFSSKTPTATGPITEPVSPTEPKPTTNQHQKFTKSNKLSPRDIAKRSILRNTAPLTTAETAEVTKTWGPKIVAKMIAKGAARVLLAVATPALFGLEAYEAMQFAVEAGLPEMLANGAGKDAQNAWRNLKIQIDPEKMGMTPEAARNTLTGSEGDILALGGREVLERIANSKENPNNKTSIPKLTSFDDALKQKKLELPVSENLGLAKGEEVVINTTNTVGSKSEHQDLTPIDPRNNNESYEQCVRRGAVGC